MLRRYHVVHVMTRRIDFFPTTVYGRITICFTVSAISQNVSTSGRLFAEVELPFLFEFQVLCHYSLMFLTAKVGAHLSQADLKRMLILKFEYRFTI